MATANDLIQIDIADVIPFDQVDPILSTRPFCKLDGGLNTRDLSDGTDPNLKTGYVFRSGSLENLTPKGQEELVQLGVKTIFDLRSIAEFTSHPGPRIDGIDIIPAAINSNWNLNAVEAGTVDLGSMYMYMISASAVGFRAVLNHILNCPERPFLFHCAAGKDRTGVTAAVVLALAGMPHEYIAREYALTRIGMEPAREFLTSKLTGGKTVDLWAVPMLHTLGGSRAETMMSMLKQIDEKYGNIDGFITQELDYTKDEIEKMRANLRASNKS